MWALPTLMNISWLGRMPNSFSICVPGIPRPPTRTANELMSNHTETYSGMDKHTRYVDTLINNQESLQDQKSSVFHCGSAAILSKAYTCSDHELVAKIQLPVRYAPGKDP